MKNFTISQGSRTVRITIEDGRFTSRLYVNHGDTATTLVRKAQTVVGAIQQARALLG